MIGELVRLFFPPLCLVCGELLTEGSHPICTACLYDMPLTGFESRADNPIVERFWGLIPIVNGCSMFWFAHGGGYRSLVHTLKYRGGWSYASRLGEWFGERMEQGGLYGDVDLVIPVPLHPRRLWHRGYNQSEYIARGIGQALGVQVDLHSVVRCKYNDPQATISRNERWENVDGIFRVRRVSRLAGRHILLVDDVLTTGATIISCADAILAANPDCRISIATLSVSKNEFAQKYQKGL